ncbi:UNVERIFIED_CONTAM: Retrovirus-related Pol polyprotein from transposon opus [Sesamum indicum]
MCTNFTDLNEACPKDQYPLLRIDLLVDSTAGYELFSIMDAYQGYHQIFMVAKDRDKSSFVTERGIYCYNVMPFGLKNAGATYQRLVNKMFANQIGKTMKVYVDDMLIKSQRLENHLIHLESAFAIMRTYGMKLNPSKSTFGVRGGKFLGYMVSDRGIEANLEKIDAILKLKSPTSVKEVQKLIVSPVLVREDKRIQNPVYYVSKMLQGAEKVVTARKLRPYFQSHKAIVLTNQPLKSILFRPEASGRLIKWAVELGEYDIDYQIRTTKKAQVLADFVMELAGEPTQEPTGILIQGPGGLEIEVAARLSFSITNNEAEYEALILGLELAYGAGASNLEVYTDSQLVAMQIDGTYETKEKSTTMYHKKAKSLMQRFDKCSIPHIPRCKNDRTDSLSKFGALLSGIKDRKNHHYGKRLTGDLEEFGS